jgi:hypothetical protein
MSVLLERKTVELAELPSVLDLSDEDTRSHDGIGRQEALGADQQHAVEVSLHHVHLPKLEAAGLLSFDRDTGVLELQLHPDIYGGPLTEHLLSSVDQAVWAAVAAVHRDQRRGAVLTLLAQSGPTLDVEHLASRLAESPVRTESQSPDRGREMKEDVEITLHHVHLPILDKVGLVTYDIDSGSVTYTGDGWFDLSAFVSTLPPRMRDGWLP